MTIRSARWPLALSALLLASAASTAEASPPPVAAAKPAAPAPDKAKSSRGGGGIETAVLVLDASGSMNEKVGEQTRLSIVQGAVRQLIQRWDRDIPLGLTAYGHHGTGCGDIEAVLPVAPVAPATFLAAVDGLRAAGGTPLTDAFTAAAEQLDYTENQATIILISDGEESCSVDPCARARSLESKATDLKIHVIGFGVSEELGQTKLACIASNTGGTYRTATDAASLQQALNGLVSDTTERKKHWRKRWGDRWGKNGRWSKGCWTKGKPESHEHRKHDGRKQHDERKADRKDERKADRKGQNASREQAQRQQERQKRQERPHHARQTNEQRK